MSKSPRGKQETSGGGDADDTIWNLPAHQESFSVSWLANFFHTSAQHWINLIESGAIKPIPLSAGSKKTMYRVSRAELLAFLKERTQ
jgi:hypothetical protein